MDLASPGGSSLRSWSHGPFVASLPWCEILTNLAIRSRSVRSPHLRFSAVSTGESTLSLSLRFHSHLTLLFSLSVSVKSVVYCLILC